MVRFDPAPRRLGAAAGMVVALVLTSSAYAQTPGPASLAQGADPADSAVSRESLLGLMDDTAELARQFHLDATTSGRLAEARQALETASPEQLLGFRQVAPQLRQLQEILGRAREILRSQGRSASSIESAGFPDAEDPNYDWNFFLPGQSADLDDAGGASDSSTGDESENGNCSFANRKTTQEMFALLNGTAVAEVVAQVAGRICEQVIVVLGGGNASIVCIITDVIFDVVKAIQDNIFLCEDILDGAETSASYQRLAHIHADIEGAQASLAGAIESARVDINATVIQAAADQITAVNNAATLVVSSVNAARDGILTSLQDNQDLFLRIEIEKALHRNQHFTVFYLPEARGGRLGLVRQIVLDAVQAVEDSGEGAAAARQRLGHAEAEYAANHWKKAFDWYAQAYFEAIRYLGEIP